MLEKITAAKQLVNGIIGYNSPWTQQAIHANSSYNDIYFSILHKYYRFGEVVFHPHKVISFTPVDRAIREVLIPMGREIKIKEAERLKKHYGVVPDKDFTGLE